MAGTLTITGNEQGLLSGGKTIGPLTMTGSATVGQVTDVTLATGDTTVTVPAGATIVLIVLPSANTATVKARTNLNSTDGGLQIAPVLAGVVNWAVLPLPTGTTSVILNASTTVSGAELNFI